MWPFSRDYFYVQVCFLHGKHPYTYKTVDRSIRINTVVTVPAGAEIKPAIVTGIGLLPGEKLPCDPEDISEVIGKADWRERRLFKGIDMRMPIDVSQRAQKTEHGIKQVITTEKERVQLRKKYGNDPRFKVVETQKPPKPKPDLRWIDELEFLDAIFDDG